MATSWSGLARNLHDFFQHKQIEPSFKKSFKTPFSNVKTTPPMKFLPTYRLEPKNPVNREIVENMMKNVVLKSFADFQYESKAAQKLAKSVSEEIKFKFKTCQFDRYRIISLVTIGEKYFQGFDAMTTFLWDPTFDGFVNYIHETPQYFVIATLYYIYYD